MSPRFHTAAFQKNVEKKKKSWHTMIIKTSNHGQQTIRRPILIDLSLVPVWAMERVPWLYTNIVLAAHGRWNFVDVSSSYTEVTQ